MIRKKSEASQLQKCDVYLCNNQVYTKGALCKDCTKKLISPYSVTIYCPKCHKIILIKYSDELFFSDDDNQKRMKEILCIQCSRKQYPSRPFRPLH